MSDVTTIFEKTESLEELQKKLFEECAAQSYNQITTKSDNESSITKQIVKDVPISIIINNVRANFALFPDFSPKINILDELRYNLQKAARGNRVNWLEFKESSKNWFLDLPKLLPQNINNNNLPYNISNPPTEVSEKDALLMEESRNDHEDTSKYCSALQIESIESHYSLNNSSMGYGVTDSCTTESSEETDRLTDDVAEIDLQVRIRRFNEETASLREEITRAEETISALEHDVKLTNKTLEKITNQCQQLRKENEDLAEKLVNADKWQETYKIELRILEKARHVLQKKVDELEKEKEDISNLKIKIDTLSKENAKLKKLIADDKVKYDKKVYEYECLLEEWSELKDNNLEILKNYEKNLEEYRSLQALNAELQAKWNKSDSSSRLSLTPPPCNYASGNIHSTPYTNKYKNRQQDSLYSELKASGFNVEKKKIQDLEEEIWFYNKEIGTIVDQIDEALQNIATSRNEICIPNLQLVETGSIQALKHKIIILLNWVKSYTSVKVQPTVEIGEDSREKPDVLPESTKTSCIVPNRLFMLENQTDKLIDSATTPNKVTNENQVCNTRDQSTSPLPEETDFQETSGTSEDHEQEIVVPITEALNRIIEIQKTGSEQKDNASQLQRYPKRKSIFTSTKCTDWLNIVSEVSKSNILSSTKNINECSNNTRTNVNEQGDGPHRDSVQVKNTNGFIALSKNHTEMKTLKSEFKELNKGSDESVRTFDMRFVTIRPMDKTYLLNPVVPSSEEKSTVKVSTSTDIKSENYFSTPHNNSLKITPRRKFSVYQCSFNVDNLQTPDSAQNSNIEKKRSVSTSEVQEPESIDTNSKSYQFMEVPFKNKHLLTTYRSANNSESSNSPSPKKIEPFLQECESPTLDFVTEYFPLKKPVTLAPTKFKFSNSIINQNQNIDLDVKRPKTAITSKMSQKSSVFSKIAGNYADQSAILSSSPNFDKNDNIDKKGITANLDSPNIEINRFFFETSNSAPSSAPILNSENSSDYLNTSDNIFSPPIEIKHETYTKGVDQEGSDSRETNAAKATQSSENGCRSGNSAARGGVDVVGDGSSDRAAAVARAMSSGEDSSAESECDAQSPETAVTEVPRSEALGDPQPVVSSPELSITKARVRSNSCTKPPEHEDKIDTCPITNGLHEVNNSFLNVPSISSSLEGIKEGISPKAFPSWTDEKLQESGIASFPDIDSEISENLSEDELKKKYTTFSVGLGTDRMTLSKRMILSRRHRDQAEKNFANEIFKMQQDIKELAPLCVDSESVERVERAKQQLEMVSRCAHRISCNAETLGAVHQERRVSRAVLLAEKYLQTLRGKCEKLAVELSETKRILAENNIVLEENLSEMGDDVPRVRYRAVANNNRTMMARRRASIATISRPLMGSNQDISKEIPRQRNSVSGRVPGLRRPSLCYETPKMEIEKLDRADSSSSIAELRDIFEQAESRRHSREENNSLIRTSINNLSTINSEYMEEEEAWSNTREDIVSELVNINEINSLELSQYSRHPLKCWLLNKYAVWKPTTWTLIFMAFVVVFFINHVVSSSSRKGPPISWWSIEEIINQYIQVENEKQSIPRPI